MAKKEREHRPFWERALQAPKIRQVLNEMGVEPEFLKTFEKTYRATRKTRTPVPVTDAQRKVCRAFISGEEMTLKDLRVALKVADDQTATRILGRVLREKK